MQEQDAARGSRFVVDFGDVQLPQEAERRLDVEIRRATLHALAGLDFRGDDDLQLKFPKEWLGIFVRIDRAILDRPIDIRQ